MMRERCASRYDRHGGDMLAFYLKDDRGDDGGGGGGGFDDPWYTPAPAPTPLAPAPIVPAYPAQPGVQVIPAYVSRETVVPFLPFMQPGTGTFSTSGMCNGMPCSSLLPVNPTPPPRPGTPVMVLPPAVLVPTPTTPILAEPRERRLEPPPERGKPPVLVPMPVALVPAPTTVPVAATGIVAQTQTWLEQENALVAGLKNWHLVAAAVLAVALLAKKGR